MTAKEKNMYVDPLQHAPYEHPYREEQAPRTRVRRVIRKKSRLYNPKFLLFLCGLGIFALMFGQLYIDAQVNRVHRQVEETRREIARETIVNEQLQGHISELSQHARVLEIASQRGLTFNENIIYIGDSY